MKAHNKESYNLISSNLLLWQCLHAL